VAAPSRIPGVQYANPPRAEAVTAALVWPPRLIVVHDTGNPNSTKENEASYAHTRTDPQNRWTSAHAYVDNGGVLGSLRLDRRAWAAYDYANDHGIHIEMCLRGNRVATHSITAVLVRQLCLMAGIPMVKLSPADVAAGKHGVCGHRDITIGLGVGDHTDPGADFPWSQFMQQVNQQDIGGTVAPVDLQPETQRKINALDAVSYFALVLGDDTVFIPPSGDPDHPVARSPWIVSILKAIKAKVDAQGQIVLTPAQFADFTTAVLQALGDAFATKVGPVVEDGVYAALESPRGQAALRRAIRDQGDDNPAT
jgi:N-acetylmuramoyl-L-alanine amidase